MVTRSEKLAEPGTVLSPGTLHSHQYVTDSDISCYGVSTLLFFSDSSIPGLSLPSLIPLSNYSFSPLIPNDQYPPHHTQPATSF